MKNKAHTATLNRLRRRFGDNASNEFDVQTDEVIIEVETSATLASAFERLKPSHTPTYVALTNKEGLKFAMSLAKGTGIGIMDPKGEIILPAETVATKTQVVTEAHVVSAETLPPQIKPVYSDSLNAEAHEAGVAN